MKEIKEYINSMNADEKREFWWIIIGGMSPLMMLWCAYFIKTLL